MYLFRGDTVPNKIHFDWVVSLEIKFWHLCFRGKFTFYTKKLLGVYLFIGNTLYVGSFLISCEKRLLHICQRIKNKKYSKKLSETYQDSCLDLFMLYIYIMFIYCIHWILLNYISITGSVCSHWSSGLSVCQWSGDLGSIPGCILPKILKMVLDTSLLNTQQYKVRI